MSATPLIDPGGLPKFRRVLSRIARALDEIVAVRGRYEPGRYGARLAFALALSLAIHAFVLSLRFGMAGLGLPGFALPWAERRAFSSDLSVQLAEAPRARTPPAAPAKPETVRSPSVIAPPAVRSPAVRPPATLVARKAATRSKRPPRAKAAARAAPAVAASRPAAPTAREPQTRPQPELIAQAQPEQETFAVPPPVVAAQQAEAPPVKEQAAPASEPAPAEEEAARRAREQEAARLEQVRREEETRRQQEARAAREALELDARRQAEEAAQQRALELEAREKAKREEALTAARLALEREALRQAEEAAALARHREEEASRQAQELAAKERAAQELAARVEALAATQRQREAERLAAEASRAALAAAESGRSAAGTIGPGTASGRDLAAKALEQLRTPGALRAEPQGARPLAQPARASAGAEAPRRRQASGGIERDIGLRMYIESWRWKIERNGNLNYPSGARTRASENPVVTVAIRRDGSVEDVLIHRSSGQRDLDDAVRRIVQLNTPYSAFPPDLARAYDVIEIRRVWVFAQTLRIVEELN